MDLISLLLSWLYPAKGVQPEYSTLLEKHHPGTSNGTILIRGFVGVQWPLLAVSSTGRCNAILNQGDIAMKRRTRIYYTPEQEAILWDRYKQGDSLHDIARMFDSYHSSIMPPSPSVLLTYSVKRLLFRT